VIVDNRPGASGIIAAELVMKAPADGYTLFIADTGHLAINPGLNAKLPYDPVKDFTPLAQLIYSPFFVFAHASLGAQSIKELITVAKAKPGINYGTSGNGTPHHLCMSLIAKAAGLDLVHVPYKGTTTAMPDLIAGRVNMIFAGGDTFLPQARAGKAYVRAAASAQRSSLMPAVPTLLESGVPDVQVGATVGLLAPAGLARAVVDRLSAEAIQAVKSPDNVAKLQALGQEMVPAGSAQYGELIRDELQRYARLVKISGAKLD
jgi:tripartite-type tricarboxylate transporter receptor subunit TctC